MKGKLIVLVSVVSFLAGYLISYVTDADPKMLSKIREKQVDWAFFLKRLREQKDEKREG